jgi:hypothetical protein
VKKGRFPTWKSALGVAFGGSAGIFSQFLAKIGKNLLTNAWLCDTLLAEVLPVRRFIKNAGLLCQMPEKG